MPNLTSPSPLPATPSPHLRVVRDEDVAIYDGQPVSPPKQRRDVDWVKHHAAIRAILGTYKGSEYKVYAFLDSWCDLNNQTWIGVERIAEGTCTSIRQVQRHLSTLEQDGWIEREPRFNEYGIQTGVTYTLPHRMPGKAHDSGGDISYDKSDDNGYDKCDDIAYDTHVTQVNRSTSKIIQDNPSVDAAPENPEAIAILAAYCDEQGLTTLAPSQRARHLGRASDLVAMGVTPDEIPDLMRFCRGQDWVKGGVNLGLMVSQVEKWRPTTRATKPMTYAERKAESEREMYAILNAR